ncbi:MAG: cytochrome ubiquinol oxidase subunit I [Rugosibacter sp.]
MLLDALALARIQFAANITFHILFPTITLSLAWFLLLFKLRHNATGDARWMALYRFWVKIFALTFALGVVTGVTMSFQFGTNWPGFMAKVGNIAGPLLAYEVLTAFFMEATFLAIMLFGQDRVSNRIHTLATVLVCIGTTLSAFWIISLNSWMHTPAGFELRNGVAHATSWVAVIFNASLPYRLTHMLVASGLTTAFLVTGLSAYRLLRGSQVADVRLGLRLGIVFAAILIPLQILLGDLHGLNTLAHQPAKLAAMEGIWETQAGVPAVLFALPDEASRSNHYEIAIPKLASLYLTHHWDGVVRGLNDFPDATPRVAAVFWSFRIMVGMGLLMLAVSWMGVWLTRQNRTPGRWLLRTFASMTFAGWIAVVAGWYTTEMGRQPWLVQGILRTADAAAPNIGSGMIGLSLTLYLTLYALLLAAYVSVLFYLARHADAPAIPERALEQAK